MGAAPGLVFLWWGFAVPRMRHELGVRALFLLKRDPMKKRDCFPRSAPSGSFLPGFESPQEAFEEIGLPGFSAGGSNRERERERKALDELFAQAQAYRSSADYLALLKFIRRFPSFAPYNCFLLHVQKPGAAYVASVRDWKARFNRTIKPGARPLVIMVTFGPVGFVYDLPDTEGPNPFPEDLLHPFRTEGDLPNSVYRKTISNLYRDRVRYVEADMGNTLAGQIQPASPKDTVSRGKTTLKALYALLVNRNLPVGARYATLSHELGHLYCGHLGTPDDTWWPGRYATGTNEREFEAESVAWLVCERAGIHNPSTEYLANYLKGGRDVPAISIDAVLKAAGYIEAMGKRNLGKRRNLPPGERAGRGVRVE